MGSSREVEVGRAVEAESEAESEAEGGREAEKHTLTWISMEGASVTTTISLRSKRLCDTRPAKMSLSLTTATCIDAAGSPMRRANTPAVM